jgi:hypothetical protein
LHIKHKECIAHKAGVQNVDGDMEERAEGRSENLGEPVEIDEHNLVDIELADQPKSVAPPVPLAPTGLEVENAIICNICNKKFLQKAYLKKHVLLQHTITALDYQCEHCKKKFISKNILSTHISRTHMNQKFVCKNCEMSYSRKFSLLRHKCKS